MKWVRATNWSLQHLFILLTWEENTQQNAADTVAAHISQDYYYFFFWREKDQIICSEEIAHLPLWAQIQRILPAVL